MTPAEITEEFYSSLRRPNGWQSVRHFYRKISGLEHSDISEGLLAVFQKRSFTAHEVGCAILWSLDVPFEKDLTCHLPELLANWDLSVEELPFYLMHSCGRAPLDAAIEGLRGTFGDTPDRKQKLDTMQWWMSIGESDIQEHRSMWQAKLARSG